MKELLRPLHLPTVELASAGYSAPPPSYKPPTTSYPPISAPEVGFYNKRNCPQVESVVRQMLKEEFDTDRNRAGDLLRLFFHDCMVEGCDASVLLNTTSAFSPKAEKDAPPNLSLEAFDVVDRIKARLESECGSRVVSCADILALSARDAVYLSGGPLFDMPTGRRDGTVSLASRAVQFLPGSTFNLPQLLNNFKVKGLDLADLIALSGAHTIGHAHSCDPINNRLPPNVDPSLNPNFAKALTQECKSISSVSTSQQLSLYNLLQPTNTAASGPSDHAQIDNDIFTPSQFDNQYYKNLLNGFGLFTSDATLTTVDTSLSMIQQFANDQNAFFAQFAASMIKLGNVDVLLNDKGQIRNRCAFVN